MSIPRPLSKQPIPPHAELVFKGKIFDVYQWEQEMFDGGRKVFEKLKRPDTVIVIPITKDGKIILTEQEQPGKESFVGVAGGRAEDEEDPDICAERELLEETGYKSENLVLWDAMQPISKIDWAVYLFIAKSCKKVKDPELDGGEKITLKFVDFDEFIDAVIDEKFADIEIQLKVLRAKLDTENLSDLRRLLLD